MFYGMLNEMVICIMNLKELSLNMSVENSIMYKTMIIYCKAFLYGCVYDTDLLYTYA